MGTRSYIPLQYLGQAVSSRVEMDLCLSELRLSFAKSKSFLGFRLGALCLFNHSCTLHMDFKNLKIVMQVCAVCCLTLLMVKRARGGELGGKGFMRTGIAALLVLLWIFYLLMSGLQSTGRISWDL